MTNFEKLSATLEFIEENLTEDITAEHCAKECGYSLSSIQKMFRQTFNIGVSDYISRRKLTSAAKELICGDDTILEIALKYGYNSHEVFTRAFMRLWGITPSEFRKKRRFSEIFPKLDEYVQVCDEMGNIIMASKKKFDVSHLYDFIKQRCGKYAVCFDMVRLMYINDVYGRAAGDIAIAECLRRIDEHSGENMLPIRIGGDEFVLITDFSDLDDAQNAAEKILNMNGNTISYGGNEIEVSMRAGYVRIPEGNLRYSNLFESFVIAGRDGS